MPKPEAIRAFEEDLKERYDKEMRTDFLMMFESFYYACVEPLEREIEEIQQTTMGVFKR